MGIRKLINRRAEKQSFLKSKCLFRHFLCPQDLNLSRGPCQKSLLSLSTRQIRLFSILFLDPSTLELDSSASLWRHGVHWKYKAFLRSVNFQFTILHAMAQYCLFLQLRYYFLIFCLQIFVSGKIFFVYIISLRFHVKAIISRFFTSVESSFFVRLFFFNNYNIFLIKKVMWKLISFVFQMINSWYAQKKRGKKTLYIHVCTN